MGSLRTKKKSGELAFPAVMLLLIVVLFVTLIVSLCCGHYSLDPITCIKMLAGKIFGFSGTWSDLDESVLLGIRLPRILGAVAVGACLAISGASYQSVFQNPLVSPDILGVSSGACVGAALAILLHMPKLIIMVMSFTFGILTVAATLAIPKLLKSNSNIMLVLSGIVVGGITGSAMGIIKYVADPKSELPQITYWTMGSLDGLSISVVAIAAIPIIICVLLLVRMSWWIDVISMGEKDAKTLGANVSRVRLITICCATLLTAISVCMCGTIGWVGLVIPHFARMFVGPSNTKLIPTSLMLGAIFLLAVDTIARTIAAVEVPLGIITGIVGAPFYAWLLYRQRAKLS